jgi:hypothetical protein
MVRMVAGITLGAGRCLDGGETFTVTDASERERFEARDEAGALAGVPTYQLSGAIIAYTLGIRLGGRGLYVDSSA